MNNLAKFTIITAVIAVVSLTAAGIIGASNGIFTSLASASFVPASRNKITVNDYETHPVKNINRIEVSSVSENITIRETSEGNITARFHGNIYSAPSNRPRLVKDVSGNTVIFRIEHPRNFFNGGARNDAVLDIGVPRSYTSDLSASGVSANIKVEKPRYSDLTLKAISGDLTADTLNVRNLMLNTTSGDANIRSLTTEYADINSVSGDIRLDTVTGNTNLHSVSGGLVLNFLKTPERIDADSVSGDIHFGMPPDAGLSLDLHSTSGDMSCDFPVTITNASSAGDHRLVGKVGNGSGIVRAHTVSGDVEIKRSRAH